MSEERVEYLYRLLGTEDLAEAIKNIEGERTAMLELHDENTALKIYNRRLRLVVDFTLLIFDALEGEGGMFLSSKVRDLIGKSRNQIALADRVISESKSLTEIEHKG